MVAHREMTLEYLIINQKKNHSFEIDAFWFLNLLLWFLFLKSLIYGNNKLTFYNKMGQKENPGDM